MSHPIAIKLTALLLLAACATVPAASQTIVEEWASVKAPPPPELKAVNADKETALLMLDVLKPNCGARPRCMASVPKLERLLAQARARGIHIVHSAVPNSREFLPEVAPLPGEPEVISGPDKFLNTDLDRILKGRGVKTVIVVGTAAEGAVLYTASGASLRGYKVLVPVDGATSSSAYAEQLTAWQLANGPVVRNNVTLTRLDQISF